MTNPVFEREGDRRFTGCIMPVYSLTAGISNNLLAGLLRRITEDSAGAVPEVLPEALRLAYGLAQSEFSYRNIHFPASWEELRWRAAASFLRSCSVFRPPGPAEKKRISAEGPVLPKAELSPFLALCPFVLTSAQKRVVTRYTPIWPPAAHEPSGAGDVGSGKTAVAAAAVYLAAKRGYQSAMMAPPSFWRSSITAFFPDCWQAPDCVGLLTGPCRGRRKETCTPGWPGGSPSGGGYPRLAVQGVSFSNLWAGHHRRAAQIRGGTARRAVRQGRGAVSPPSCRSCPPPHPHSPHSGPHNLRDLDISVIDELPPGRRPVSTYGDRGGQAGPDV
jgi:ATP-dependent DNA helicase RecG